MMEDIDEKTLTKKPLLIDLLVIIKLAGERIDNPIGNIFRIWNIMEYKSPTDYVNGIYYFLREGCLPVQFIILEELDAQHKWLAALTNQITKEMLHSIAKDYNENEKNEYKEAILDTVLKANYEFVKKLKEEESMAMSKEVLELFRPEIEEAEIKGEIKLVTAIKKKKEKGLDTKTIADTFELEEEYVEQVMEALDQNPGLSIKEITRIIVEKDLKLLA